MINSIIKKIRTKWINRSSKSFLNNLRKQGIRIGKGTIAFVPSTIRIDTTRPELVEIGENVFLHRNTIILTHDWASWCFVNLYSDFIPSHSKVKIGNNVWFGESCTILKGVTIGDNCIIGIGSIITKDIPSNSVAVGCPAKVICSIDEYYQKRKKEYINEAVEYALEKLKINGEISPNDFSDDYPCFVDGRNFKEFNYPYSRVFSEEHFLTWTTKHKAPFSSFNEFLNYVRKKDTTTH